MSLEPCVPKELLYTVHAFPSSPFSLPIPGKSSMRVLKPYMLSQPVPLPLMAF